MLHDDLTWEALTGLAAVAASAGELESAARLAGAASAGMELELTPAERPIFERLRRRFLDPARSELGEEAWDRTERAGNEMPLDEAIAPASARSPRPSRGLTPLLASRAVCRRRHSSCARAGRPRRRSSRPRA